MTIDHVLSLVLELDKKQLRIVLKEFKQNQNGSKQSLRGRIMQCLSDRPGRLKSMMEKIVLVYNAGIQYSSQQFSAQILNPVICDVGPPVSFNFNDFPFMQLLKIHYTPMQLTIDEYGEQTISFNITDEDNFLINESWDRDRLVNKIQIVLMFKTSGGPTEPEPCKRLPLNMTVAINDTVCDLPELNTDEGNYSSRLNVPIDISSYLNPIVTLENILKITWREEPCIFTIGIFMVEKFFWEELIDKIVKRRSFNETKELIKELLRTEIDLSVTTMHTSIKDPISHIRMKLPARGLHCAHLQCFDAEQFLQMNEEKETWKCPFCAKQILLEDIVIDEYFLSVLQSPKLSKEAEFITLFKNGTWVDEKKKK